MAKRLFDFEEKHENLYHKIEELRELSDVMDFDITSELELLQQKMSRIKEEKYKSLSPWERVLLSRHAERPGTRQYFDYIFDEWIELHGDRCFGDDKAIIGGIADFGGIPVTILGHQKGKNTKENVERNFGMPHPEGYRKTKRLLLQAEKFKRPVITFIDTPGAYPGIGAEERGQAWAIAEALMTLSGLKVPIIAIVIGEGGSGGALALAVSDRLAMLSNAVFSVASPEASASILWKDLEKVEEMAKVLKLTSHDLKDMGIIDDIIEEPLGGANQDFETTARNIKDYINKALHETVNADIDELVQKRYLRLRNIGRFEE